MSRNTHKKPFCGTHRTTECGLNESTCRASDLDETLENASREVKSWPTWMQKLEHRQRQPPGNSISRPTFKVGDRVCRSEAPYGTGVVLRVGKWQTARGGWCRVRVKWDQTGSTSSLEDRSLLKIEE